MAYGDTFKQFLIDNGVPAQIMRVGDQEPFIFLDSIIVDELRGFSCVKEVRNGGLIIGKFHIEGGIHMLQPFEDGFQYVGEMEGYEFLFGVKATSKYYERIIELNNSVNHKIDIVPKSFKVSSHIKRVDLRKVKFQIIVIPSGLHYILNRTVTEKNLELLDKMNDQRRFSGLLRFFRL